MVLVDNDAEVSNPCPKHMDSLKIRRGEKRKTKSWKEALKAASGVRFEIMEKTSGSYCTS